MSLLPRRSLFDFDDFFQDFYSQAPRSLTSTGVFSPRVDITETDNCYEIVADLPGFDKDSVSITLENGVLTIQASNEEEKSEELEGKVIRKERHTGQYLRSFTLGQDIKEADIDASFENGVLTLKAPKAEVIPATCKRIEIH